MNHNAAQMHLSYFAFYFVSQLFKRVYIIELL